MSTTHCMRARTCGSRPAGARSAAPRGIRGTRAAKTAQVNWSVSALSWLPYLRCSNRHPHRPVLFDTRMAAFSRSFHVSGGRTSHARTGLPVNRLVTIGQHCPQCCHSGRERAVAGHDPHHDRRCSVHGILRGRVDDRLRDLAARCRKPTNCRACLRLQHCLPGARLSALGRMTASSRIRRWDSNAPCRLIDHGDCPSPGGAGPRLIRS
jgi:hypothetical protein